VARPRTEGKGGAPYKTRSCVERLTKRKKEGNNGTTVAWVGTLEPKEMIGGGQVHGGFFSSPTLGKLSSLRGGAKRCGACRGGVWWDPMQDGLNESLFLKKDVVW